MSSKQKLTLFDLTMVVVGLVIGMGIFRTAATSAQYALNPVIYFSAWIAGGLIALCGALTYAEIGSRYPVTGGYYRIFSHAYHPSIAFSVNCIILISNAASLGAVALIGSGYISQVIFNEPATDLTKALIATSAVVVFYGVNLLGLRMSAKTQNVLMIIKIGMIVMLIAALFMPEIHQPVTESNAVSDVSFPSWIHSFGASLIAVSFTYGGYQQTINFGSDVQNASRNIPRGIFMGIAIIIGLYLLVNLSYFKVIGFTQLQSQKEIASIVAAKMFGQSGGSAFSALLFLSVLAYVNVLLMSNPRVMFAMSEDGVLPAIFQQKSKKKDVLVISLSTFAAICIIIVFLAKTFEEILNFTIFLDCFGMAASAASIFSIRRKTKHLNGTGIYSMKLYPLMPLVFICAYVFVGINIAMQTPGTALVGLIVLASFMGIYFLTHKKISRQKTGDDNYDVPKK
ncbi:APC family permease [Danxiaibacter flavus]|uniref:APC family permease n=1 Tax=Danxiaibacter flavus TaxID=3049108 RepID=A0ABV3ZNM2_9BACT|nr:APC family permease [Chitinophagaceae bacterium DXS]